MLLFARLILKLDFGGAREVLTKEMGCSRL